MKPQFFYMHGIDPETLEATPEVCIVRVEPDGSLRRVWKGPSTLTDQDRADLTAAVRSLPAPGTDSKGGGPCG